MLTSEGVYDCCLYMYHHLAIVLGICGIANSSADKQPNKTKTELQTMQYPFHYMSFLIHY